MARSICRNAGNAPRGRAGRGRTLSGARAAEEAVECRQHHRFKEGRRLPDAGHSDQFAARGSTSTTRRAFTSESTSLSVPHTIRSGKPGPAAPNSMMRVAHRLPRRPVLFLTHRLREFETDF